jgi:hypothetical protein
MKENAYMERVEEAVRDALAGGAVSPEELCRAARGAFPTDVMVAANCVNGETKSQSARIDSRTLPEGWPEPFPGDFEWRFTVACAAGIANCASDLGAPIACLGTPTVFSSLVARGREAVLIDRNPFVVKALYASGGTVIEADVGDLPGVLNGAKFPVVIMDPPWYPAHIRFWLTRAVSIASDPASLVLPLFPELVRPGALAERLSLTTEISRLGSIEMLQENVTYATPLFEQEVLSALGAPPLKAWRVADLVILHLQVQRRNPVAQRPKEDAWDRFLFGSQVVGVRRIVESDSPISVVPLYNDGSFLRRSVSARDPDWGMIGVWTSRNRVLRATGTDRLRSFLAGLSAGHGFEGLIAKYSRTTDEVHALRLLAALIGW